MDSQGTYQLNKSTNCEKINNAYKANRPYYAAFISSDEAFDFHKEAMIEIARMPAMIPSDIATGIL